MQPTIAPGERPQALKKGAERCAIVLARLLVVLLLAGVLVAGTESLVAVQSRGGLVGFDEIRYFSLFLATLLVAAMLGLGWALTNRLLPSVLLLLALLIVISQAHERKNAILAKALTPWDFFAARQILALFPTVTPGSMAVLVLVLGSVLILASCALFLLTCRPRWPLPLRARLLVAAICAWFMHALADWKSSPFQPLMKRMNVVNVLWDNHQNVERNGLLLSLVLNTRSIAVYQPGYSRESVLAYLGAHRQIGSASAPVQSNQNASTKPDVILYMAEAMWDPTALGVRFSRDPIPTFRRLWSDSGQHTLLSPTYGGGTANAEFEILTGIPMAMFPDGSYPYQHYLSRPVESLASHFRDQGYKAVALHPFYSWYWARNSVYPLLGFQKFVSLEQMEPVPRQGPYPSDEPLADKLLQELDDDDPKPLFAFAISVVTHGPYLFELKTEPKIKVLDTLPANTVKELENYATLLSYADRALGQLVERLKKRDRPTILIVFGDHLPALGKDKSIYRDTGFLDLDSGEPEQQARMARVPVALWTNVPGVPPPARDLGMSFFGAYVLRVSGMRPGGYFGLLDELSIRLPVLQQNLLKVDGRWYRGSRDPALPPRNQSGCRRYLPARLRSPSRFGFQPKADHFSCRSPRLKRIPPVTNPLMHHQADSAERRAPTGRRLQRSPLECRPER